MLANGARVRHEAIRARARLIGGSIAGALDILFAITYAMVNGWYGSGSCRRSRAGMLGKAAYEGGGPRPDARARGAFRPVVSGGRRSLCAAAARQRRIAGPAAQRRRSSAWSCSSSCASSSCRSRHSRTRSRASRSAAGFDLLSHMFLFGLPIVLAAARAIRRRGAS